MKILTILLAFSLSAMSVNKTIKLTPNIKTFLDDNCVKCHNDKKTKSHTNT